MPKEGAKWTLLPKIFVLKQIGLADKCPVSGAGLTAVYVGPFSLSCLFCISDSDYFKYFRNIGRLSALRYCYWIAWSTWTGLLSHQLKLFIRQLFLLGFLIWAFSVEIEKTQYFIRELRITLRNLGSSFEILMWNNQFVIIRKCLVIVAYFVFLIGIFCLLQVFRSLYSYFKPRINPIFIQNI
jgi:hypothetical protein